MNETLRIGYLTSRYPARSHTFIRREIEALRMVGFDVIPYSIRRCEPSELLCDLDEQEYQQTWAVLPVSAWNILVTHARALWRRPLAYLQALLVCLRFRRPGVLGALYSVAYFAESILLAMRLRADKIGLLHVHFGNAGALVANAAAEYVGIPWAVTYHGASDFGPPTLNMMGWQIRRARFVRCVSYFGLSQAMRQATPDLWPKMFVCYSGISAPERLPLRQPRPSDTAQPFRILTVGRLSPEKGQIGMLICARHLELEGLNYTMTFAGDGPDREMLQRQASELGILHRCHFLGSISEQSVYALMCESDVLACPSLMEGLPQVLIEAMAVGLPVIAPGIAGIPELVQHDVNGLLYPPAQWEELANSIVKIARNPSISAAFSARGRDRVINLFSMSHTIIPLAQRLITPP